MTLSLIVALSLQQWNKPSYITPNKYCSNDDDNDDDDDDDDDAIVAIGTIKE